jgi:acyl-CoA thioesterase-1
MNLFFRPLVLALTLSIPWAQGALPAEPENDRPKTIKWIFVGDSITAGYGVSKRSAYPSILESALRKSKPNLRIVNAGVSGSTTASAPRRVKWVLRSKPELIVLALGGNDALRGIQPAASFKALDEAIEIARKGGARVALLGMKAPTNMGPAYTSEFDAIYSKLAKKHQVKLYPFLLEGVALDSKLNQPDQIHPNEKGHEILASKLETFFRPILTQKNGATP